jgi:hypothetical protein
MFNLVGDKHLKAFSNNFQKNRSEMTYEWDYNAVIKTNRKLNIWTIIRGLNGVSCI